MKNLTTILLLLISNVLVAQQNEYVTLEGFYFSGDELSSFHEIDFENQYLNSSNWVEFRTEAIKTQKFRELDVENYLDGIYIKVICSQKFESSYGHLGAWKSQISIFKILEVDATRTFSDYVNQNKVRRRQSQN